MFEQILAAIDVTYALTGRISAVYLLDAGVEVVLLSAVLGSWLRLRRNVAVSDAPPD